MVLETPVHRQGTALTASVSPPRERGLMGFYKGKGVPALGVPGRRARTGVKQRKTRREAHCSEARSPGLTLLLPCLGGVLSLCLLTKPGPAWHVASLQLALASVIISLKMFGAILRIRQRALRLLAPPTSHVDTVRGSAATHSSASIPERSADSTAVPLSLGSGRPTPGLKVGRPIEGCMSVLCSPGAGSSLEAGSSLHLCPVIDH